MKNPDLIFGLRPVMEAIHAGKNIDKLMIQRGLKGEASQELITLCKENSIQFQSVPIEKLNRITRKNHQGVIALTSPIPFHAIEDIIPQLFEEGKTPLILVLDGVTDTRNFGAIVRTAECAGVHAVVIPDKGSARIGSDAVKTSTGALFKVPICKVPNLTSTIQFLSDSGIQAVACTEKTNDSYLEPDYTIPMAIVMGSEEDGISDSIIRKAAHLAKIPIFGTIGSLNVSVACGVILFEAQRQRGL